MMCSAKNLVEAQISSCPAELLHSLTYACNLCKLFPQQEIEKRFLQNLSAELYTQETLASNPRACSRVPARLARNPALIPVEAQDRVRCACGGGDDTVLVDSHTTMLVWIRFESLLGIHI